MTLLNETLHPFQLLLLALAASKHLTRDWFLGVPSCDHYMTILLLTVYTAHKEGSPLHKKAAWSSMGLDNARKSRAYIERARKLGLVEVIQSPQDARKELVLPTMQLERIVEKELTWFAVDLHDLMSTLLKTRLGRFSEVKLGDSEDKEALHDFLLGYWHVLGAGDTSWIPARGISRKTLEARHKKLWPESPRTLRKKR